MKTAVPFTRAGGCSFRLVKKSSNLMRDLRELAEAPERADAPRRHDAEDAERRDHREPAAVEELGEVGAEEREVDGEEQRDEAAGAQRDQPQ
jgi:hypothetical protein